MPTSSTFGNLLGQARVNAAQVTSADDRQANFVVHSEAPIYSASSRRNPCTLTPALSQREREKHFLCGAAAFARTAVFAFLLRLNEAQKFVDCWDQFVVGAEDFASVIEADLGAVEQAMGFG